MKTHPRLNASYVDGRIWLHEPINVLPWAATWTVCAGGSGCDQKALSEIEREIRPFEKAQKMHFSEKELLAHIHDQQPWHARRGSVCRHH
jgi:hypothetical protein